MSEETTQEQSEELNSTEEEGQKEDTTDWKARSRMWENKARSLQDKADKFDEIEEANKSELEKALERAAKAEGDLEALKAKAEHDALVGRIAAEKGVPAHLLNGDDEEALNACADAMLEFASSKKPSYPADTGGAAKPAPMSREAILAVEDPAERLALIAENLDAFD